MTDPHGTTGLSEKAIGVGRERYGSFIIAVDRSSSLSTASTPVLYKTNEEGSLLWTREVRVAKGTAFDAAVNSNLEAAYLVVSSPAGSDSPYANGHVVRISGISSAATPENVNYIVSEELIFSTNSSQGTTKLFGCALDRESGDLYITGGTSDSLYGQSSGKSDVIVVRISSTGLVLASTQLGTRDDEFGRAIAISTDSAVVAVAVQKIANDGGQDSIMYRLDADNLRVLDGPQSLLSYAATPIFIPNDITISGPTAGDPSTRTTVICGGALTVPDRRTDLFFHVYANISGSNSNVAVYVDGSEERRRDDFATAVRAGDDGNLYSIGYSSPSNPAESPTLILTVVSPTGKIVHNSGHDIGAGGNLQVPNSMALITEGDGTYVIFAGYTQQRSWRKPFFGTVFLQRGTIPPFEGFGSIVEEAGSNGPESHKQNEDRKHATKKVPIVAIIAGVAGGLAGLLFICLVVYAVRVRRVGGAASGSPGEAVTSEHFGDASTSPGFPSREEVVFEAKSVLV